MAKSKSTAKPKAPGKTKSHSKSPAQPPTGEIDPAHSTAAAAAMVAHKVSAPPTGQPTHPETAGFRHLKESLNKPHAQTMGGLLDKISPAGQKKSSLPFAAGKQVGHNQTFGADVSRRNLPRRTGG